MVDLAETGQFARFAQGPDHRKVPRDPIKNLEFRDKLYKRCARDLEARRDIVELCKEDFLFWLNAFVWVFEPRSKADYPFASWPYQDDVFRDTFRCLGVCDVGVEKSRDMGVTWMMLAAFTYLFLYQDRATFGLVSRNELLVVDKADPDTLFWKVKYLIDGLPSWLQPKWEIVGRNFVNFDKGGTITGYSATGDVARGGRRLAFLMDELASFGMTDGYAAWASTMSVTNTRIAISTPQGDAGIFADVMNRPRTGQPLKKMRLHWTAHPIKNRGLYTVESGRLKVIDESYKFPPDYKFVLDGKLRSPWYDVESLRHPSPVKIAQELDIDYGGSGSPFFDLELIGKLIAMYARKPTARFQLDWDEESRSLSVNKNENGNFAVWYPSVENEWYPSREHDYAFGVDVATGKGGEMSTNSTCSIVNCSTGEKVAEFADPNIDPSLFAYLVADLRKVFAGPGGLAWLGWEANGPGGQFGKKIIEVSPGRIYMRQNLKRRVEQRTQEPGWWSTPESKRVLLGEYQDALRSRKFTNYSDIALDECRHYVFGAGGDVYHNRSKSDLETSSAGVNHGDRVIADALAHRMRKYYRIKKPEAQSINVRSLSPMTFAGRRAMHERKLALARKLYW